MWPDKIRAVPCLLTSSLPQLKTSIMYKLALVVLAVVAAVSAAPLGFGLGAPLLSKVNYQPAEYTHIQPEVTVQAPEYKYKSVPVPVPVAQPYYTAPVVRNFVAAPAPVAVHHAPAAFAAPAFHFGLPAATTAVVA